MLSFVTAILIMILKKNNFPCFFIDMNKEDKLIRPMLTFDWGKIVVLALLWAFTGNDKKYSNCNYDFNSVFFIITPPLPTPFNSFYGSQSVNLKGGIACVSLVWSSGLPPALFLKLNKFVSPLFQNHYCLHFMQAGFAWNYIFFHHPTIAAHCFYVHSHFITM